MCSHSEHVEPLVRELEKAGITPELIRTHGGHLRIKWKAGGNLRSVLTSWTPSDHRSTLNSRARIRAYLREDGMLNAKPKEPSALVKALSVPAPAAPRETDNVRIERLERDVNALLDIISDLSTKLVAHGVKLDDDSAAVPQLLAPPPPPPPPPPPEPVYMQAEVKKPDGRKTGWQEGFLFCIGYQDTPVGVIISRSGVSSALASMRLSALKKAGLVENTSRGIWRKTAPRNGNGGHRYAARPESRHA